MGVQPRTGCTPSARRRGARDLTERVAIPANMRSIAGVLCGLAAAAIWGGGAVVSRHLVTTSLDPAALTLLRYAGCFPIALLLMLAMGERVRLAIGWPRLLVLLLLGGPLYQALVVAGYRHATAAGGALLLSGLLPVFALGLNFALSGTVPRLGLFGAAAVIAGLVLFSGGSDISSLSFSALIMFAVAAATWAAVNEFVRRWQVDPLQLTLALAVFSPVFLPLYLLTHPVSGLSAPLGEVLLQVAYHGWLVAIGATALFFAAVRLSGAHIAAVLQALSPGFSACFGAVFLGEPVMPAQGIGLLLVIGGVLLAMSAPSRQPSPGERDVGAGSWPRAVLVGLAPRLKPSRWS